MKDVGLVGLPYSGKSTLFTALTRSGGAGGKSNQAVVDVPDERVAVLTKLEGSKKVVHSKVRFVDVPGGLTSQGIAEFRTMDALCMVVRAFGDDAEPLKELSDLEAEMIITDLASVESGLEKARKKAKGQKASMTEVDALERARVLLEDEKLLRAHLTDAEDLKVLRGYGPLTLKPWIVVASAEEGADPPDGLPAEAISMSASLEAEVAGMDEAEALELLQGFGVEARGLDRVIGACYRALDLITFLTTGADETRAWEVRKGAKAPEAAGVIHSDLERGFIRAEVCGYEGLVEASGWDAAKQKGLIHVEGKEYEIKEGDVLNIRFAV